MPKAKNVEEYISRQQAAVAVNPDCGNSHYNLAIGLLGLKNTMKLKANFLLRSSVARILQRRMFSWEGSVCSAGTWRVALNTISCL